MDWQLVASYFTVKLPIFFHSVVDENGVYHRRRKINRNICSRWGISLKPEASVASIGFLK